MGHSQEAMLASALGTCPYSRVAACPQPTKLFLPRACAQDVLVTPPQLLYGRLLVADQFCDRHHCPQSQAVCGLHFSHTMLLFPLTSYDCLELHIYLVVSFYVNS